MSDRRRHILIGLAALVLAFCVVGYFALVGIEWMETR